MVAVQIFLFLKDRHSGLVVRQGNVGDEAHLKAGPDPLFEDVQILGRLVRGDDDLLLGAVEGLEGMEELLLGRCLVDQELDIVDQEHVDIAVLVAEAGHHRIVGAVVADGVDQLVRKFLAGHVQNFRLGIVL